MIAIIGYGQIGKGLSEALNNPNTLVIDPGQDHPVPEISPYIDVMHICFPPGEGGEFKWDVNWYIDHFNPALTIIHSSVIPGETRRIQEGKPEAHIVYSPVRGRHSRMSRDIKHYTKFLGAVNIESSKKAAAYFKDAGIKTHIFSNPETPELVKLLDNLYYAWDSIYHDFIADSCEKYGVQFTDWQLFNKSYNEQVVQIPGREDHMRSVLEPPKGKLGGTCLWENAWLLSHDFDHKVLDHIVKFDPEKLERAKAEA